MKNIQVILTQDINAWEMSPDDALPNLLCAFPTTGDGDEVDIASVIKIAEGQLNVPEAVENDAGMFKVKDTAEGLIVCENIGTKEEPEWGRVSYLWVESVPMVDVK